MLTFRPSYARKRHHHAWVYRHSPVTDAQRFCYRFCTANGCCEPRRCHGRAAVERTALA